MCFPAIAPALPAILGGLGVAQTGLQYMGARRQAKQQAQFQAMATAAELGRVAAERTSVRMRQAQEQEAVGRELEQVHRKSQAALSRAVVSAGEAGVAGASVQALMDDYMRQEGAYRASILRQQALGKISTSMALEDVGLASQQRLMQINQPIDKPNPLGAVIGAVSSGLSGYSTGLKMQSMMGGVGSRITNPVGTTRRASGRLTIQGQKGDYVLF